MKFCPNCGQELSGELPFCPSCGTATKPFLEAKASPKSYSTNPPPLMQSIPSNVSVSDLLAVQQYSERTTLLLVLGIVAATFGMGGFLCSIVLWIMAYCTKLPAIRIADWAIAAQLEAAQKRRKTAVLLALVPVVFFILYIILLVVTLLLSTIPMA